MKNLIQKLVINAIDDIVTSFAGTIVGLPDFILGLKTHDFTLVSKGIGEIIIGLSINLKNTSNK